MAKQDWTRLEYEVGHYFMHEPGAHSANLDPDELGHTSEPRPPRFPAGADYWTMMTVAERLLEADKVMPCRGIRYELKPVQMQDGRERTKQEPSKRSTAQPSASMVLRAAYGTLACKYDDSAPDGAKLLKRAQEAYCAAAERVPPRVRPSRMERVLSRFDRAFGTGASEGA